MSVKGLLKKVRKQVAVYWEPGHPDESGQEGFGNPIEIKCRWTDITAMEVKDNGDQFMSRAIVIVDRQLRLDGVLWLSTAKVTDPAGTALGQLTDANDPFENAGALRIQRITRTPDIRAKNFIDRVVL